MPSASTLQGQHAIVTGGSRGIGLAIARALLGAGAKVTIMAREQSRLDQTLANLSALYPGAIAAQTLDVGSADSVAGSFAQARAEHGKISILVNNAGIGGSAPLHKIASQDWLNIINVNLNGVFFCCREVLPEMLAERAGRIINIASTAGVTGYRFVSAYTAAKHGVVGLTRSLALEVAQHGITVNAVCPGFTETDILWDTLKISSAKTGKSEEQIRTDLLRNNPCGKFIKPEEVASAALWLASPEQGAMTGQTMVIAGGEVL